MSEIYCSLLREHPFNEGQIFGLSVADIPFDDDMNRLLSRVTCHGSFDNRLLALSIVALRQRTAAHPIVGCNPIYGIAIIAALHQRTAAHRLS